MEKFIVDNNKERILCYSAGILGAWLGNNTVTATAEVDDWMIKRAINAAQKLIETIYAEK